MSAPVLAFNRFVNKNQPQEIPDTKIVAAYGLRKCPKLVLQVSGPNLEVRVNALEVLCDEFQNPYSVDGCVREGVISVLSNMVTDADFTTRVRATKALSLAANDSSGLLSILETNAIPLILLGVQDPSEEVRGNVYTCLRNVTKAGVGAEACVTHGVITSFVKVLSGEIDSLKPILLRAIHNMVDIDSGLVAAIMCNAVEICISLIKKSVQYVLDNGSGYSYSEFEFQILSEAAEALGLMCFDGRAKIPALEAGAVEQLIKILKIPSYPSSVKASITSALMAITITDEGKIQIFTNNGVDCIMALLYDDSRVVILNALKILSNIAVYPKTREIITTDSTCVVKIRKLSKSEDKLVAKHAAIALAAANWMP